MTWNTGSLHYLNTPSWTTNSAGESLKEISKSTTNEAQNHGKSSHGGGKTALIVGAVIAAVAGLILLTALCCLVRCCLRRRRRTAHKNRDPAAAGMLKNKGWQKVDGEEKLGDEDFGGMSYNSRDKLLNQDVPVYNARGMAYEPFRPVADKS